MLIREFDLEERPREKLLKLGPKALTSSELLAIILRTGSKKENVIDLSRRLINKITLEKLSTSSVQELENIKGIGFAKACQIIALFELADRREKPKDIKVQSPKDVFLYVKPLISGLLKENFIIILLNTKNKILKHEIVSIGTLDSALIHPREVFRTVLKEGCNSIILVHNHPSGDPTPSKEDIAVTKRLIEAGELLGVEVLDHVIIGLDSYWSYKHDEILDL